MGREDADVAEEIGKVLSGEGIDILLNAQPLRVDGLNGRSVSVTVRTKSGERKIEGSHLLVAIGRIANTADIGLDKAGIALDCARLHPGRRAAEDDRPRRLGDRRMRRQPAVHACFGR